MQTLSRAIILVALMIESLYIAPSRSALFATHTSVLATHPPGTFMVEQVPSGQSNGILLFSVNASGFWACSSKNLCALITSIQTTQGTIITYINDETNRAKGAEAVLTINLNAEISRAKAAEATLTSNLNAEISRAKAAESAVAGGGGGSGGTCNCDAETTRATDAENTIATNLNNEVTRAQGAESTLTTNLNNEVTRAKAAEGTINGGLNNEITRAQGAESTLTTNLNNEVTRAKAAESTLATNLNNEVTRAQGAESTLATNLNNEVNRALVAEGQLSLRINALPQSGTPKLGINYIIALQGIFPSRARRGEGDEGEEEFSGYIGAGNDEEGGARPLHKRGADPFLGEIELFAGNFAPLGWAFCAGQILPIDQNQALFAILGTTYGGDGRTTFALPDLRSRVPIGAGGQTVLGEVFSQ